MLWWLAIIVAVFSFGCGVSGRPLPRASNWDQLVNFAGVKELETDKSSESASTPKD